MKFTDTAGREYTCVLHAAKAIKINKELGLNLRKHFDGSLYERLADDTELLVNVLAEVVRESIVELGIDDATFGASLGGNALDSAYTALRACIVDFSPPGDRPALLRIQEKTDLVSTLGRERMNLEIDLLTPEKIRAEIDDAVEKAKKKASSNSAGSSSPSVEPASETVSSSG